MRDDADAGAKVIERLRALPGGAELLELAQSREDVDLVGGAVRDLLLERAPRELDIVVAGDAPALAMELATRLGAQATVHERFATAYVEHGEIRVDLASQRAESYAAPGALPEVRPGTPAEDLLRRDFTVNALAVRLGGRERGALREAPYGLEDLERGRLRVLHEQSFRDDPTRLLRLARYRARLGFAVEPRTAALVREALAADALRTVSGGRIGAELRLLLAEPDPSAGLAALTELGVLSAIHPRLRFDAAVEARALELLPADGRADLLSLAALALPLVLRADGHARAEVASFLRRLEFPAHDRDRVVAAAVAVPRLVELLARCEDAADLHDAAAGVPVEGVALAGALGGDARDGAGAAAERWLEEVRHVRLQITGEDLLAAGVPQGPEIGRRLRETLALRLRGELGDSREAELAAALAREASDLR